jgi:hypothetical protein
MIEFLQKILIGHNHEYEVYEKIMVCGEKSVDIIAHIVVLRCKKCGKMKNHKIDY